MWARCLFFSINHYVYSVGLSIISFPSLFIGTFALFQMYFYLFIVMKNGAEYYFDYFSKRYEINLKELDVIGN